MLNTIVGDKGKEQFAKANCSLFCYHGIFEAATQSFVHARPSIILCVGRKNITQIQQAAKARRHQQRNEFS